MSLGPYRTPPKLNRTLEEMVQSKVSIADEIIERCCRLLRDGHRQPDIVLVSQDDYESMLCERVKIATSTAHARVNMGRLILHGPGGVVRVFVGNVDEPQLGWMSV